MQIGASKSAVFPGSESMTSHEHTRRSSVNCHRAAAYVHSTPGPRTPPDGSAVDQRCTEHSRQSNALHPSQLASRAQSRYAHTVGLAWHSSLAADITRGMQAADRQAPKCAGSWSFVKSATVARSNQAKADRARQRLAKKTCFF